MRPHSAKLILRIGDPKLADSLLKALEPDNKDAPPGVMIKGMRRGGNLLFKVSSRGPPARLLATLDDLFICVQTAEKSLKALPS